ncbi:MAG: heme-binding domain-containing protein [Nitrospinae bacterium]|nr:heme-binding domain-containing protein [Nitrospinota bacterium]
MRKFNGCLAALAVSAILLFPAPSVYAHGGERHEAAPPAQASIPSGRERLAVINERYIKEVKPIFKRHCFDCHSKMTVYPWYYAIPGAGWLIDRDIRKAREHMDMSADFPFKSHSTPLKDLEAIEKAMNEGTMPPWRYRIMHTDAPLGDTEKAITLRWAAESRKLLTAAP